MAKSNRTRMNNECTTTADSCKQDLQWERRVQIIDKEKSN